MLICWGCCITQHHTAVHAEVKKWQEKYWDKKNLVQNLALLHSGKCVPVSILLLSVHTHTHTQQHACSHIHTHSYAANEQAAFPLGISIPICFFLSTFTPSLYPSSPSFCIPTTASPLQSSGVLTRVTHTYSYWQVVNPHTHTCVQIIHKMAPFLKKQANSNVMKYTLFSLTHIYTQTHTCDLR